MIPDDPLGQRLAGVFDEAMKQARPESAELEVRPHGAEWFVSIVPKNARAATITSLISPGWGITLILGQDCRTEFLLGKGSQEKREARVARFLEKIEDWTVAVMFGGLTETVWVRDEKLLASRGAHQTKGRAVKFRSNLVPRFTPGVSRQTHVYEPF